LITINPLTEKSHGIEHKILLYDVIDFHLPTFKAVLSRDAGFLGGYKCITVLTDKKQLQRASELESILLANRITRAFCRKLRAKAGNWLSE